MSAYRFHPSVALVLTAAVVSACAPAPSPRAPQATFTGSPEGVGAGAGAAAGKLERVAEATAGPTGRLLVVAPGEPGSAGTLVAVDTRTGAAETLWPVFDSDERGASAQDWAVSSDGRRIAYRRAGGTGPDTIVVRDLVAGGARRDFLVPGGAADQLLWLPDGTLAYGWLDVARARAGQDLASLAHWALRRLDPATGRDEAVVTLDAAQLGANFARLAGYDPAAGRAALLLGPGENFYVDTIRLLDTATGATVADLRTHDTGFQAAPSPDGKRVAYGECLNCAAGGLGTVNVLALAAGPEPVAQLRLGEKVVGLRWAPDGQSLAWTTYSAATSLPGEQHTVGAAVDTGAGWRPAAAPAVPGSALAWSPDSRLLLTNQVLFAPNAPAELAPSPFNLPPGVTWDEAPWRVVGWVPDAADGG